MDLNILTQTGFIVDYNRFYNDVIIPESKLNEKLKQKIFTDIGECNLNNPFDLSRHLAKRGYRVQYCVTQDWLRRHRKEDPIFEWLVRYKTRDQFLSFYGDNFRKQFIAPDGRIHPQYYDNVSATGRMSARNPPAMALDGRLMKYVIPAPDNILMNIDFSALDFRSLAAVSHDRYLQEALSQRDFDIHARNASIIFGTKEISAEQRKVGKQLGLAIVYGMSTATLAAQLSGKTGREISEARAADFINDFYKLYPFVKIYQRNLLMRRIRCRTLGGREYNPDTLTSAQILNYPIQGTSSEGFRAVVEMLQTEYSYAKIILIIHDSVMFELPENLAEKAQAVIPAAAEDAMGRFLGVKSFVKTSTRS